MLFGFIIFPNRLAKGGDSVHLFDAGRGFDARGHVDQGGVGGIERGDDIVGIKPAGETPVDLVIMTGEQGPVKGGAGAAGQSLGRWLSGRR